MEFIQQFINRLNLGKYICSYGTWLYNGIWYSKDAGFTI